MLTIYFFDNFALLFVRLLEKVDINQLNLIAERIESFFR